MTSPAPAEEVGPGLVLADGERRVGIRLFDLGLACCAVEFVAAAATDAWDAIAAEVSVQPWTEGPRDADVLVVSGTVTPATAPAVRRAYEQLREPRLVVSFGACVASGGPYWDSYAVTPGIAGLVPVDCVVPGCPPRPQALVEALRDLLARRP